MIILLLKKEKNMEIQEQQFVRELAESRMQIELLRNRVLLRYYAQLLELDIMEQTQEVKALMSSINTLERYARKYEPKEPAIESAPVENGGSGEVSRDKEGESESVDAVGENYALCFCSFGGREYDGCTFPVGGSAKSP